MKKSISFLFAIFTIATIEAAVPQKMNYQAVVRNSSNALVVNSNIGIKISILQGSATGTVVYVERQFSATNANGLVTIQIGTGTVVSGTFSTIDWSTGVYFIKSEYDLNGGSNYTISGTSEMLSVPYAMYAENSVATTQLQDQITKLQNTVSAGGYVYDIDGNKYNTVKIGTQIWMAENLKTTRYNDGTKIPNVKDSTTWFNLSTGALCYYKNDSLTYSSTYGPLYNWYAVNTAKLAPAGWHVPSDAEWTTLTTYLGGINTAGGKLKQTGILYWNSPNIGATNETGFTALPAGRRDPDNNFVTIKTLATFWSSTIYQFYNAALGREIYNDNAGIGTNNPPGRNQGKSIRCVKD